MPAQLSQETVITRFESVHGDRYDYSKYTYNGVHSKSSIICKYHGEFMQSYRLHYERKNGCPLCAKKKTKRQPITKEEFIKRANKIHNSYYDYSQINYTTYKSPLTIRCRRHGSFTVSSAHLHILNKNGCPLCARRKDTTHFIKKSREIFGNYYDYSKSHYETVYTPLLITCPEHGPQLITPAEHYRFGCCFCHRNRMQDIWLDNIGIPRSKEFKQVRFTVEDKLFVVDGFDPSTNTVFLFHGDYWHGNPEIYNPTDINAKNGKTFGDLYEGTKVYEQTLLNAGFKIVTMWEYEWLQQKTRLQHCRETVRAH